MAFNKRSKSSILTLLSILVFVFVLASCGNEPEQNVREVSEVSEVSEASGASEASEVSFEDKWNAAFDLIINRNVSNEKSYMGKFMQYSPSKSDLKSKNDDDLVLRSDFGFEVSMETYDYSGESSSSAKSIITPLWSYQRNDSGMDITLFNSLYRGRSLNGYRPAYLVEYLDSGKSWYACKSIRNEGDSSPNPDRTLNSWYYSNKDNNKQMIWSDSTSTKTIYGNLCELLEIIKDYPDKAVYNEETKKYDLSGIAYFEVDPGTENYDSFKDFVDDMEIFAKVTFDEHVPPSAKIVRPLKVSIAFDDQNRISFVSSDVINQQDEFSYMQMYLQYGKRNMSIKYLDDISFTVDGLPTSSLSEILSTN